MEQGPPGRCGRKKLSLMNTNQSYVQLIDAPSSQYITSDRSDLSDRNGEDSGELAELPAIDGKVFEKLRTELAQVAPELMVELIHYYLTNTPGLLAQLRQAVDQADAETLNRMAHMLKSNSARLGAMTCTLCQELEIMGQTDRLQGAAKKLAELEREYERARIAFELMK